MKIVVVSLGGSLIIPKDIDYGFLKRFKKIVLKFKNIKFVFVIGGGHIAREYIKVLEKAKLDEKSVCLMGIAVTRLNARFMANFFRGVASQNIPNSLKDVENMIKINRVIFAGALRFEPKMTSDGTAASIANHLKTEFVNLTNVDGLYNKDPKKFKNAKFIPEISLKDFYKIVKKMKYKAGQHFVLDQHGAEIIMKHKVKTVILNGNKLGNFENYLKGKKFRGTIIK